MSWDVLKWFRCLETSWKFQDILKFSRRLGNLFFSWNLTIFKILVISRCLEFFKDVLIICLKMSWDDVLIFYLKTLHKLSRRLVHVLRHQTEMSQDILLFSRRILDASYRHLEKVPVILKTSWRHLACLEDVLRQMSWDIEPKILRHWVHKSWDVLRHKWRHLKTLLDILGLGHMMIRQGSRHI